MSMACADDRSAAASSRTQDQRPRVAGAFALNLGVRSRGCFIMLRQGERIVKVMQEAPRHFVAPKWRLAYPYFSRTPA
jgi:hypothetical protein